MLRRPLLTALALLASAAAPTAAQAAGTPAGPDTARGRIALQAPVARAVAVSSRHWGSAPCGGRVAVLARQPLAPGMDRDTNGWVTFGTPTGANDLTAAATTYTRCTLHVARWRWPTPGSMREDWDLFCATVVHEMGHLLGHAHDPLAGSVMAPVFADASTVPAACRAARPGRPAATSS